MFRDNMVVSSSKVWKSPWRIGRPWKFQPLKMRSPCCLEMLSTNHPVAWQHITEELQPHMKRELHSFWSLSTSSLQYTGTFGFVPSSLRLHIYTTEYFNTCRYWTERLMKTNINHDNFFVHLFYSALCIKDYMSILGSPVDEKLDRIWKEEFTV